MIKRLKKLLMLTALLSAAMPALAVEVEDYYKDYTAAPFSAYRMGYTPTFTQDGWQFSSSFNLEEKTDENAESEQYAGCEVVIQNGKEYFKTTTDANPWIQFFASDDINCKNGETYTISAMIKATNPGSIHVVANWGWGNGQSTGAGMSVSDEWAIQTVELTPTNDSFTIVLQPGNTGDNIYDIKWISVSHIDDSIDADFLCMAATGLETKSYTWDQTIDYEFDALPAGTYYISFDVYSDVSYTTTWADGEDYSILLVNGSWDHQCLISVNADKWTKQEFYVTIGEEEALSKLSFFIGKTLSTKLYFDNIVITRVGETENLISNGNFAKAMSRGWSKPSWHSFTLTLTEGPGHYTTLPVKAEGWGTFCSNKALKFGEVTAYTVKGVSDGKYIVVEAIDGAVPANTGVMLIGDNAEHQLLETVETPDAFEGNLLKPGFAGTTIAASDANASRYVYGVQNEVEGFFKVGTDVVIPDGKDIAYLEIPVSASKAPQMISFGADDTSAIIEVGVDANVDNNVIYNLQGMPVDRPIKGIYIVNGKKVMY